MDKAPAEIKGFFQGAMSVMKPYGDTQRIKPFTAGGELVPGIRSQGSYGHTAGHTVYVVESKGQKLLLIGDLIHVAPVQLGDPSVTLSLDSDEKAARSQRLQVFNAAAKEGVLVGASHISFPGLDHLRSTGKGYQWLPVNYTQMR